jgi:Family of unknown function (DUF5670)
MFGRLLWAVVVILVVLWLLGWLAFRVGGGLIHILIVVALIVLLYNSLWEGAVVVSDALQLRTRVR